MKTFAFIFFLTYFQLFVFSQSANQFNASGDIFGCRVFIENKGQFSNEIPNGDAIKYGYINGDEKVYFSPQGVSYLLEKKYILTEHQREKVEHGKELKPMPIKKYMVNMIWENANSNVQIEETEQQTWYHSYGDEKLKSNCFKKIKYKNVYNNIDIEYVFTDDKIHGIKYNIILHPGAVLSDIQIKYTGDVEGIKIKNGTVIIKTPLDDIVEHSPISYQNGIRLDANFIINNDLISFEFPKGYDNTQELIIDPWVTSLSTLLSNNYGYDVDYDYAGNLYVFGGISTYKIAKYDPSGVLLWTFSGVLAAPVWTSSGNYPYPLIGNFIVDKFSQSSYTGQGYFGSGTRIIRIDGNGLYNNYISTQNSSWQECWDFGVKCSTGEILGFGGDNGSNKTGSIINQTTGAVSPNSFNPTFSSPGQDVVNNAIDDNGDVFVIYASVQTTFLDNKISKINPALNNNIWIVPSQYLTLKENENKSSYIGAGLALGSSNGFNCLAVNSSYLFYYDGFNVAAYDKSTGARLAFTTIAGQTPRTMGGIAVDDCNNVYLGANNTIKSFNFNGTVFSSLANIPLNTTSVNKCVYDLKLDKNSNMLYVSGSGFAGVYSAINSLACSNIQLSVIPTCIGTNNASAVGTLTTNILNPVVSYSWTNSVGTVISQTNGTSSLINSITGLTNGIYTLYSQINAPCGPIVSQTLNINCVITPSQSCSGSLEFNNISDEVLLPLTNQMYSSNGFTWECWFKLNTPFGSQPRALIMNEDPVVYEDIFLGFGWNLGTGNFAINHLGFKVDGPNATTGPTNISCDYAPPGGFLMATWYHAAGVMDYITQTAKLYLNGVLVDTKTVISDSLTRTIQGHLSYSPNLGLGGNIDEVRIWKKARTSSEIFADYNQCLNGNEPDLVSYYRCNQSTGTIVTDATINGNNGVFANSTTWSTQQPVITGTACATSSPSLTASSTSSFICSGTTVTLSVSGVTSYTWNTGTVSSNIVVTPSVTTTYTVNADSSACSGTGLSSVITVSVFSTPTISIASSLSIICSGQSTTLTAIGASTYTWNPSGTLNTTSGNMVIASPLSTTNYSVTGTSNTCTNSAVVTVSVLANPTLILSPNATICQGAGASTTLTASGATSYTWANAASLSSSTGSVVIASPNVTTNYTVTGANAACTNTAIVTVSVNPSPTITATTVNNTSCGLSNGSATVISLPSNNTYTWSSGVSSTTNTASNLVAGNYTITINNGACQTNTVISIIGSVSLSIISSTVLPSNCNLNDGSITITDNMIGSNYSWSPNVSVTNNANGLPTGNYALTIINGACTTSTIFNVGSIGGPLGFISITGPSCDSDDGSIVIDSIKEGVKPYSINFNNNGLTNNMIFENLSTGNYTLSIRDSSLCETEYVLTVPSNKTDFTLYIPNTFTPNNDKVNDIWLIKGTCLDKMNCLIYNRWGEKIRELRDINEGWDGTYKGVSVPDGVYIYLIEVSTKEGTINKAGHITVFR
jgi:gliding motility-associated-like protein